MRKEFKHKKDGQKKNSGLLTGPISINMKGVGFFDLAEKDDSIEIQKDNLGGAFNGDIVEISLTGKKTKNFRTKEVRKQGRVIRIISRNKSEFVGIIENRNGEYFLVPDDKRMYTDIKISPAEGGLLQNQQNSKALVVITKWPENGKNPVGKIIKIIGKIGENNTEMESIVLEKGFHVEFPPEVENDAQKIKTEYKNYFEKEIKNRRDMRGMTTFTIDPSDAKDFDDAISINKISDDQYEIGIHIADVSYFVRPGSVLDREAQKRGLSVYLVDRTIPMLPEILSNDLCSLNPNEDKFTFSAIFKINSEGKILNKWFGRTVIHSNKRFTYDEAQEIIKASNVSLGHTPTTFQNELVTLNKIAKKLEKQKYMGGAINFETEEVKFELDSAGKPIRVYKKQRLDTHKLVEEYMLLANREVAKFIFMNQNGPLKTSSVKQSVYRIHGKPNEEKIKELAIFLKALGFDLRNKNGEVTSRDINNLLKEVEGTSNEELIKTATIRSMAKAIYSTKNIGHFGLAFSYYTHFTSPIRRYPDLLVHRFLERELSGGKIEQNEYEKFEKICLASSESEKRASDAERASIKYKQVEYMKNHIGEIFDGTITGVTDWGIYVEEKETKCEGMISVRSISDDFYVLDEKNYTLRGQKTKRKFTLGDTIKFKVASADLEKRTLDYEFI